MFFEGSEKKIELIFKKNIPSLRTNPPEIWAAVVESAHAKILSQVSNEYVTAYLLSESSLFVYDHSIVMITCGTTRLVHAVEKILSYFKKEDIDAFFYERKNEIFPYKQHTHFFDDVRLLNKQFKGEVMRYGREDEHHVYLYSSIQPHLENNTEHTMEILMHGIPSNVVEIFRKTKGATGEAIRKESRISEIVKGQIDDFVFEPMGYSLNAIDGKNYYTIHITPEKFGNYTSFETNAYSREEQTLEATRVLSVFQPTAFDLMLFNPHSIEVPQFEGYILKRNFKEKTRSGYSTQFLSYYLPDTKVQKPARFKEFP